MTKSECRQCGKPVDETSPTRVVAAMGAAGAVAWYCGAPCQTRDLNRKAVMPVCVAPGCSRRFEPKGRGRPPKYCSDSCRKSTDGIVARALKRAARGSVPRDVDGLRRAIFEGEWLLMSFGADGTNERFHGHKGPDRPDVEVDAAMLDGLRGFQRRLQRVLEQRQAEDRVDSRNSAERVRAKRIDEARAEKAKARNAWREKIAPFTAAKDQPEPEVVDDDDVGVM